MVKKVNLSKIKNGIKNESMAIQDEVREKTLGYVLAGLGVVSGLAWNDAIKAFINYAFPLESANSLVAQFAYASFLTIFVVVVSVYLSRLLKKNSTDEENQS
jgi:hypothetical protein